MNGDVKLFTKAESHFVNGFEEGVPLKETMPTFISSTVKMSDEDTHVTTNSGTNGNVKQS